MQTLERIFGLPLIADLRQRRTADIHRVLSARGPAITPLGYAFAHHCLEGAEEAARAQDGTLLAWYRNAPANITDRLPTDLGQPIVVNPAPERMRQSALADTSYYVLGPDTTVAGIAQRELARKAVAAACAAGFSPLLREHAPIVVLLDHKTLRDTLLSWAITRLPGTVFTDYTDHPLVLGRDLIHEAGHNWLNDALAACHVTIPQHRHFYSPWRGVERPAFGFLHACWAFPLTVIYAVHAASTADEQTRTFLTAHLRYQARMLGQARVDFATAASLIEHEGLRERMTEVFETALQLTATVPSR